MYDITDEELIANTFYITYAFLMTTATITLIEALKTKNPNLTVPLFFRLQKS